MAAPMPKKICGGCRTTLPLVPPRDGKCPSCGSKKIETITPAACERKPTADDIAAFQNWLLATEGVIQ